MGFLREERRAEGFVIVSLCREPVNTLDLQLWRELKDNLTQLERDPSVQGVIYTSGLKRDVFTAGNDLAELYAPKTSEERYTDFWVTQNHFLAQLYRSPLITVSAIRGACPADFGHIGLNEVALGITVPLYWGRVMARVIGQGPAERLCQFAALISPQEALKIGLVDEVVSREQLLPAAEAFMLKQLKIPALGRSGVKLQMRLDFTEEWEAYPKQEAEGAWIMLTQPAVVKALEGVFKRLAAKKESKL